MKNKIITILLITVGIVLGWYWTEGYVFTNSNVTSDSIENAIFHFTSNLNEVNRQGEILEKIQLERDTILVFTLNQTRDSVHAFIIKKKWNGNWRVEDMSGGAPIERHPGETHPYYWTGLSTDDFSGYWGIIYDSKVDSIVLINNNEEGRADIIDTPNISLIWYKLYPESNLRNIDIIRAVDSNGKEVVWDAVNK